MKTKDIKVGGIYVVSDTVDHPATDENGKAFALVLAKGAKRRTQSDTAASAYREDGIEVVLLGGDASRPYAPLIHNDGVDFRDDREDESYHDYRKAEAHFHRAVVDDFGNEATVEPSDDDLRERRYIGRHGERLLYLVDRVRRGYADEAVVKTKAAVLWGSPVRVLHPRQVVASREDVLAARAAEEREAAERKEAERLRRIEARVEADKNRAWVESDAAREAFGSAYGFIERWLANDGSHRLSHHSVLSVQDIPGIAVNVYGDFLRGAESIDAYNRDRVVGVERSGPVVTIHIDRHSWRTEEAPERITARVLDEGNGVASVIVDDALRAFSSSGDPQEQTILTGLLWLGLREAAGEVAA